MDQLIESYADLPEPEFEPDVSIHDVVASQLDAAYYRHRNPDVAAAGADPVAHYLNTGWREGRDPVDWFSTEYYLRSNPDVAAAEVNPFWHYLVQGRREGRSPAPPGWRWRTAMQSQATLQGSGGPSLPPAALEALLAKACIGARGLAVALSHDRYTEVPGGTQLLIAGEQRKFNGDLCAYLHLSPAEPGFGLAASPPPLSVILDGADLGVTTAEDVIDALAGLSEPAARVLVVHNLHGHDPDTVADIAHVLEPRRAIAWAHDYGAGCSSPWLLRNNIAFCAAPPADSHACRICTHGAGRAGHLERLRMLFETVPFHLAAPSETALAWWQRAAGLPVAGTLVHPHAQLRSSHGRAEPRSDTGPVRVAFVGQPSAHKGWSLFRELAASLRDSGAYTFFHFASADHLQQHDGIAAIEASALPDSPFGMVHALAELQIDLVAALSPWPETFGYVPYEALAAGADVVALAASGNIAAGLRDAGHGVVLDDEAALMEWFISGDAARHARGRRRDGMPPPQLRHTGSTATLGGDAQTYEPDLHLLCGAIRVDAGQSAAIHRFTLPPGCNTVRLRSRFSEPVWEQMRGADQRRLGVAVTSLSLDGEGVPLTTSGTPGALGQGWYAGEAGWRWTSGDAEIHTGGAATLEISILPLARYWRVPLFI